MSQDWVCGRGRQLFFAMVFPYFRCRMGRRFLDPKKLPTLWSARQLIWDSTASGFSKKTDPCIFQLVIDVDRGASEFFGEVHDRVASGFAGAVGGAHLLRISCP